MLAPQLTSSPSSGVDASAHSLSGSASLTVGDVIVAFLCQQPPPAAAVAAAAVAAAAAAAATRASHLTDRSAPKHTQTAEKEGALCGCGHGNAGNAPRWLAEDPAETTGPSLASESLGSYTTHIASLVYSAAGLVIAPSTVASALVNVLLSDPSSAGEEEEEPGRTVGQRWRDAVRRLEERHHTRLMLHGGQGGKAFPGLAVSHSLESDPPPLPGSSCKRARADGDGGGGGGGLVDGSESSRKARGEGSRRGVPPSHARALPSPKGPAPGPTPCSASFAALRHDTTPLAEVHHCASVAGHGSHASAAGGADDDPTSPRRPYPPTAPSSSSSAAVPTFASAAAAVADDGPPTTTTATAAAAFGGGGGGGPRLRSLEATRRPCSGGVALDGSSASTAVVVDSSGSSTQVGETTLPSTPIASLSNVGAHTAAGGERRDRGARDGGDEQEGMTTVDRLWASIPTPTAELRRQLHILRYETALTPETLFHVLQSRLFLVPGSDVFLAPVPEATVMEYNEVKSERYGRVVFSPLSLMDMKAAVRESRRRLHHHPHHHHCHHQMTQPQTRVPGGAEPPSVGSSEAGATSAVVTSASSPFSFPSLPLSLSASDDRVLTIADLERSVWHIASNCAMFNAPESFYPQTGRSFALGCTEALVRYCREQLQQQFH